LHVLKGQKTRKNELILSFYILFVFSPNNQNYIHGETNEYNSHHYSLSSQNPILSRKTNENNILLNHENEHSNNPLSSSKVKWMGAVRTVKQLNQVRNKS
jgi:hypothetical protein